MAKSNKYLRRANFQFAIVVMIVAGVAIYMNADKLKRSLQFHEPEIVEEFIESIPSEMP